MSKTKVIINGVKVFAETGKTIMEVVHDHHIDHIPNLCMEKQLEPYNSCFLCLVEVKGINKLIPACSTVIRENMEITTNSSKIVDGRKASLELLLSNHYADCLAPCAMTCPAGVDVQGYIAHVANGDYQAAIKVIKQTNPLPAICGRVCTRPCELECRRNLLDSNVKIDFLKRYASDFDMEEALAHVKPEMAPDNDFSIAVIGAGPAGLSAAYYLRLSGYQVTIFEGMPEPGGMLRYGIPEYRLPYDVLNREIDTILELGVTLQTNSMLGEDMTIKNLFDDGFDAVFLGIGAWGSRSLGVKGQDAEGILSGIAFLEELGRGRKPELHGKIVVVGGGNTAVDCARTSLRLDTERVVLLYRRTRNEMPANEMEIEAAEHEGVEMHFLAAPIEVITENNRVKALKCIKMELGEPDSSGRRRPVPVPGSDFIVECDYVFAAIGQNPKGDVFMTDQQDFLPENGEIKLTRWESVIVNPDTFESDTDGVFAGGDMVTGAATVIEAVAAGRKAAHAIDGYFTDGISKAEPTFFNSRKDDFAKVESKDLRYDKKLKEHDMPEMAPEKRIKTFEEVELGYTKEMAFEESKRCLECGCDEVFVCKLREYATEYNVEITKYKGAYGEYKIDRSHRFIELDQNKCILCGRCIRVCSEVVGEAIYGFNTRGFSTSVIPEMGKLLGDTNCISCGQCIATCPTGAITMRSDWVKPGPWNLEETLTTCSYCGVGCSQTLDSTAGKVIKATAGQDDSPTRGNLCGKGRFGTKFINDKSRFLIPETGKKSSNWADAVKSLAQSVKTITANNKADEIAVCISPRLTNEEIYLIQKFARVVLKTNNVFSISSELNQAHNFDDVYSTASYPEIEQADALLISGADLPADHRVADFMVRRSVRNGGKLVYVSSTENKSALSADVFLKVNAGTDSVAVMGILKIAADTQTAGDIVDKKYLAKLKKLAMRDVLKVTGLKKADIQKAAQILIDAASPIVISEKDYVGMRDVNDVRLLADLSLLISGRIVLFTQFNNAQGLVDMKKIWDKEIYQKAWSTDLNELSAPSDGFLNGLKAKQWKSVLIFGEDLPEEAIPGVKNALDLLKKVDFLMVADIFKTKTMGLADVKLPLCTYAETDGTFTNSVRSVNFVQKSIEPLAGLENWELIVKLVSELDLRYKFNYGCIDDVQDEMATLIPVFSGNNMDLEPTVNAFDSDRINLTPEKSLTKSIRPTNCLWTWFAKYWKRN